MRPKLTILAGGKGTRLHSITQDKIPKPMVEVFGKPFLYWLVRDYVRQGFRDITICTGHLRHVIEEYPWEIKLKFIHDTQGWAGNESPYYIKGQWVVNGDTWIVEDLPAVGNPTVIQYYGVDAGAHYTGLGKTQLVFSPFYDIGTPKGLDEFLNYAIMTQMDKS